MGISSDFQRATTAEEGAKRAKRVQKRHTSGGFVQLFSRFFARFAQFSSRQIFKSQRLLKIWR